MFRGLEKNASISIFVYRIRQITFFFLENALKKPLNIFSKLFFYLKVQSFRLIVENNFSQMAASAAQVVFLSTLSIVRSQYLR